MDRTLRKPFAMPLRPIDLCDLRTPDLRTNLSKSTPNVHFFSQNTVAVSRRLVLEMSTPFDSRVLKNHNQVGRYVRYSDQRPRTKPLLAPISWVWKYPQDHGVRIGSFHHLPQ